MKRLVKYLACCSIILSMMAFAKINAKKVDLVDASNLGIKMNLIAPNEVDGESVPDFQEGTFGCYLKDWGYQPSWVQSIIYGELQKGNRKILLPIKEGKDMGNYAGSILGGLCFLRETNVDIKDLEISIVTSSEENWDDCYKYIFDFRNTMIENWRYIPQKPLPEYSKK